MSETGESGGCCPVGRHEKAGEIDAALRRVGEAGAESLGRLAARHGLPKATMSRHRLHCMGLPSAAPPPSPRPAAPAPPPASTSPSEQGDGRAAAPPPPSPAPERPRPTASDLDRRAFEAKVKGRSLAAIGEELGLPELEVAAAVEREARRRGAPADVRPEVARAVDVQRCDAIIERLWQDMTEGGSDEGGAEDRHRAARYILHALERRAKILGLDAPTAHTITIQHPAVQTIVGMFISTQGRALEPLLAAEGLGEDGMRRVLEGLLDAGNALAEGGEPGFERWLEGRRRDAGALLLTE